LETFQAFSKHLLPIIFPMTLTRKHSSQPSHSHISFSYSTPCPYYPSGPLISKPSSTVFAGSHSSGSCKMCPDWLEICFLTFSRFVGSTEALTNSESFLFCSTQANSYVSTYVYLFLMGRRRVQFYSLDLNFTQGYFYFGI